MNWTASLLRNQLKKQQEAYESRLNLLTNTSLEAQSYLNLEAKLKETENNLITSEQNLTELKNRAENTEKLTETEVKELELKLSREKKKTETSKELIFNLRKEIRTNNLYYQGELTRISKATKEASQLIKQKEQELTKQKAITEEWKEAYHSQERELAQLYMLLGTGQDINAVKRGLTLGGRTYTLQDLRFNGQDNYSNWKAAEKKQQEVEQN